VSWIEIILKAEIYGTLDVETYCSNTHFFIRFRNESHFPSFPSSFCYQYIHSFFSYIVYFESGSLTFVGAYLLCTHALSMAQSINQSANQSLISPSINQFRQMMQLIN